MSSPPQNNPTDVKQRVAFSIDVPCHSVVEKTVYRSRNTSTSRMQAPAITPTGSIVYTSISLLSNSSLQAQVVHCCQLYFNCLVQPPVVTALVLHGMKHL
jgi:hypothetical protein